VFPLQLESRHVELEKRRAKIVRPRLLGTINDDELQLSDFVFAPTTHNATLVYELTSWLRMQRTLRWDQLRVVKIPEDSSFSYAARARLPWATLAERYDASAYFDVSGTYEQATQAMSNKFRSNLRRRARLADSTAPRRFRSYHRPEDAPEGFDVFLKVEASGWKGQNGTSSAIRCRPGMLAFYSELVREFAPLGNCFIHTLWHGDLPIAAQFGLRIGRTLHILKVGYRDTHALLAPGILLHEMTIRHACQDPGIDVLSLVNSPPWAKSFRPLTVGVWLYRTPNWTMRGLLAQVGLLAWNKWKIRPARAFVSAEEES
jgi:hypothetical protein